MSQIGSVEIVEPATSRNETTYVMQFAGGVLIVAAVLLAMRGQPSGEQEMLSHQISAYTDLNTIEQGAYNDLLAASLEIDAIHADTLSWPTVEELASMYVSPFVQDQAWRQRGKLEWEHYAPDSVSLHEAIYVGISSDPETSGSFLLSMTHAHAAPSIQNSGGSAPEALNASAPAFRPEIKIWHHAKNTESPVSFREPYMIADGWREVVTYSGADERRRFTGAKEEE